MSETITDSSLMRIANHELTGRLNRASGQGAVFSLYLAMQMQPGAVHPGYAQTPDAPVDDAAVLQQLNQYRRAPLATDAAHLSALAYSSILVAGHDIAGMHLWQAMHPDPLAMVNDKAKIAPEVVANCSLPTQLRQYQDIQHDTAIPCDETLLNDVVEGSRHLLTA